MATYQVVTRRAGSVARPARRRSRAERWRQAGRRFLLGGVIIATLATLLGRFGLSSLFFVLLPVCTSILIRRFYLLDPRRFLLTSGVTLAYFGAVTGWELFTHRPETPEIVIVTTTLALAVLFEPIRVRAQAFLERRLRLSEDTATKAVGAFTATLREEIDLDRVRDGLLGVVEQAMQPRAISMWVRTVRRGEATSRPTVAGSAEDDGPGPDAVRRDAGEEAVIGGLGGIAPVEVTVAAEDSFLAFARRHPGALEVERLPRDSSLARILRADTVELAVPLASQGELIGLLTLGPRLNGEDYAREDRGLLATLAAQVAPALRVAQLVDEQRAQARERERVEQELRTARAIQHAFLPKDVPVLPGWQITPYYQPAREVGGDFYDFLPLPDGRLGLVIGDVTGKGVPAALVMATVHTLLRSAAPGTTNPGEVLARVNELLCAEIPPGTFVTCFYAILDPTSGLVGYANAGHDPPYRHQAGGAGPLWATGMPLGMLPGASYDEHAATMAPGESVLFYSDGLVEAHNGQREMFGLPRLAALVEERGDAPTLVDIALDELARFTGPGWEQEDDVTLVLLRRTTESDHASSPSADVPTLE